MRAEHRIISEKERNMRRIIREWKEWHTGISWYTASANAGYTDKVRHYLRRLNIIAPCDNIFIVREVEDLNFCLSKVSMMYLHSGYACRILYLWGFFWQRSYKLLMMPLHETMSLPSLTILFVTMARNYPLFNVN